MKNAFRTVTVFLLAAAMLLPLASCGTAEDTTGNTTVSTNGQIEDHTSDINEYAIGDPKAIPAKTMSWPENQVFPTFKAPTDTLIAIPTDGAVSEDEMVTMSCLEGLVNAVETRMVVLDDDVSSWLNIYGFKYTTATMTTVHGMIKELVDDSVAGVVLYSTKNSKNYINLACSVASMLRAVPMTDGVYRRWIRNGIELPVLADLRDLEYTSASDIYQYFYDNYWENSSHRVLVVQSPGFSFQMRDLASACGAAVVYLSCSSKDGKEVKLFKKFLSDMTPGESIVTGWYADQERELMTVCAQYGLSCVPSDYFSNPTVFAQDIDVAINPVPDMPEIENKIYIAYYMSDGDNIQYDMHAMRSYWNGSSGSRGKVAVNWTISPALADIAPGMMDYYYSGATDHECFVCGPSGMGYTMPINTFGANTGTQFKDMDSFSAYVRLTDRYLQKSGLRVVTIWDNLSKNQREIYTSEAPYLYGLTVHHFTSDSLAVGNSGIVNDMLIQQLTPGYFASNAEGTTPLTDISGAIRNAVSYLGYDGSAPVFVAAQVSVWAFHSVSDIVKLEKSLSEYYENIYGKDVVEFVRADHYYNLYYEANSLPFDLTLSSGLTASATSNPYEAALTTDGTPYGDSIWIASEKGEQSLTYSLDGSYAVNRVALLNAGTNGLDSSLNTRAFTVEISPDGENWTKAAEVSNNVESCVNVSFDAVNGSFVRITVTDPGEDGIARIADVNIYGAAVSAE